MSATTVMMLVLPVAFLAVSVWFANRSVKRGAKPARAFFRQVASFAVVCLVLFAAPMIASAAGTDTATTTAAVTAAAPDMTAGLGMIAAALSVGIAGVGGGIAVAAAAPAAIGATSEDPKAFGKAIIFVALGEGIALYGLLISILILQKF